MTNAQKDTLDQIKKEIPYFDFYDRPDLFEIKKWEVKETDYGCVIVSFVTGPIGDDGTLASILCRKHRRFFIGTRGGVTAYKHNKKTMRSVLYSTFPSEVLHISSIVFYAVCSPVFPGQGPGG